MPKLTADLADRIVKESLFDGYRALVDAGCGAKNVLSTNVDIATAGDKIVGEAMLKRVGYYDVPFVVYSEESGVQKIGSNPASSVVYDDIDGTDNFKYGNGALPHGSIIGVFENADPAFEDCLAAGFLEFNSGNLYFAGKGRGAHLTEMYVRDGIKFPMSSTRRIHVSGASEARGMKIANDQYMMGSIAGVVSNYAGEGHWVKDFACKAMHIAQVAEGSMDVFITADNCARPNKRCTAEELAPGWLILNEAGGATMDFYGNDIRKEKVGLGEKKTYDFVMAANEDLGKSFVRSLERFPAFTQYRETSRARGF